MRQTTWAKINAVAILLSALLLLARTKKAQAFPLIRTVPSHALRTGSTSSSSLIRTKTTTSGKRHGHPTVAVSAYTRPEDSSKAIEENQLQRQDKQKGPPYPKIGDIVRYYDVDGGSETGQVLVGKIVYISAIQKPDNNNNSTEQQEWTVDLSELDSVGSGYYAEYSSRSAPKKRTSRNIRQVAPILSASYVRSEDAYKIPMIQTSTSSKEVPKVSYEQYKLEGYQGPKTNIVINDQVLQSDLIRYEQLKGQLFRDSAILGAIGTVIAQFTQGTEEAICYAAGAISGVGYLYFLTIKTDTVGQPNEKFGSKVSGLRFLLPFLLVGVVAIRNIQTGMDDDVIASGNFLSTVSKEQIAAIVLGFLTYRIPLFLRQLAQPLLAGDSILPGSAGIAFEMLKEQQDGAISSTAATEQRPTTILLVCGPEGTGKTSLVKRFMEDDKEHNFVLPRLVDKIADGPRFEVMEGRGQILKMMNSRYALSIDGIMNATASTTTGKQQAVVIDADVDLARQLLALASSGKPIRIIGVWVGLDSLEKLRDRLRSKLASTSIPSGETEESIIRGKIRKVIKDIEFGVVSGVFDFTILNDDFEQSVMELKEASKYCFK